jgi:hypothetical protein
MLPASPSTARIVLIRRERHELHCRLKELEEEETHLIDRKASENERLTSAWRAERRELRQLREQVRRDEEERMQRDIETRAQLEEEEQEHVQRKEEHSRKQALIREKQGQNLKRKGNSDAAKDEESNVKAEDSTEHLPNKKSRTGSGDSSSVRTNCPLKFLASKFY